MAKNTKKYVYFFGNGKADGKTEMKKVSTYLGVSPETMRQSL